MKLSFRSIKIEYFGSLGFETAQPKIWFLKYSKLKFFKTLKLFNSLLPSEIKENIEYQVQLHMLIWNVYQISNAIFKFIDSFDVPLL